MFGDGAAFGKELTEIVKSYVEEMFASRDRRIATLEFDNAQLKAKVAEIGQVEVRGVYLQGTEYQKGNLAVCGGSLWHAEARTKSRPGIDSTWKLVCKNGTFSQR